MHFTYVTTADSSLRLANDRSDGANIVSLRCGRNGRADVDTADIISVTHPLSEQHVDGRVNNSDGKRPGHFRLLDASETHLEVRAVKLDLHAPELAA